MRPKPAGLAQAQRRDASVNSRNSPVTTNATCSPMSTALSPIRSSARATSIIVIAHSRTSGVGPDLDGALEDLLVEPVDLLVLAHEILGQRHVAQQERLLGLRDLGARERAHALDLARGSPRRAAARGR